MEENPNALRYKAIIPEPLQFVAQVISMVFHPVFVLSYAYLLLAYFNPFLFGEVSTDRVFALNGQQAKGIWFINIVLFSSIVPIVGVLIMWGLGMVNSLALATRDERKIPYILAGMFYMALVASNNYNTSLPLEIKAFCLGATIALFLAFFINLFSKISMHTVGMGSFLGMVVIITAQSYHGSEYLFIFALLVAGLVGTSRMLIGAHNPADVYGGYLVGFLPQFIALDYMFN